MAAQKFIKRTRRYNKRTRRYNKRTRRHNKKIKKTRRRRMKGGAPPLFQAKLIEIQTAQPGQIIQIHIKFYREPVKLESVNHLLQVDEKLKFKDFVHDHEALTPTDTIAAVEALWSIDNLTPNPTPNPNNMTHGLCRLFVDNEYTGQQLVLIGKPTLEQLESDNEDVESGETMDIVFIFRKWPLATIAPGGAAVPAQIGPALGPEDDPDLFNVGGLPNPQAQHPPPHL
jgi:hypothetical protein